MSESMNRNIPKWQNISKTIHANCCVHFI